VPPFHCPNRDNRQAFAAFTARNPSFRYVPAAVAEERTLILVKPDAFERGLTGEVIARFERKGLRLTALKLMRADEELAKVHYAEHVDKPFFGELVDFITRGELVALVLEGANAVKAARQVIGATDPIEADAGSIRGEFGTSVTFNLVHGSDSPESAEREIGIWFPEL
jgi:nucleoside-diphosphate kinase